MKKLSEIIGFNSDFKNAINLYLNLNKIDKINSYIPTKSSVDILKKYLSAVDDNKRQSTLLIGPYGKGKSHLLLVLLAVLSLKRSAGNEKVIETLMKRIGNVDESMQEMIGQIWKRGKFLPVIIMSTQGDLNQAFLVGLNEALKKEGLKELSPETFFTHALETIAKWENEYPETYKEYKVLLKKNNIAVKDMHSGLVNCDANVLEVFKQIYPRLSSGGVFNPLATSEVLPMYKSIAEKLREEHGYSGIYIVFDEFSKFIESQDKRTSGNNMKLLQDMCELANDSKETQIFLTMVAHKSIKEYGKYLSAEIINSFTGIEGRLEEVYFITSSKNNYELIENAIYKEKDELLAHPIVQKHINTDRVEKFFRIATFPTIFTKEDFENTVVKGCYPLSPTSAYLLLNVSEKVGQNERTLFTFISKEEQYSMAEFVKKSTLKGQNDWIVNADLIYDYFKGIFKKDLINEYVHNEWLNAEYALSQTTSKEQIKVLKSLAVINIVNKPDELPANRGHLELVSGVLDIDVTIRELETSGLIYKKGFNDCYVFKTRATSQLKTEIKKRKNLKGDKANISSVLATVSDIHYILPKRYNSEYCMTRYFRYEYMDAEQFLDINDDSVFFSKNQFCDGKVIVLFTRTNQDYSELIIKKLEKYSNEKLVVIYNNKAFDLLNEIQEFEVIQELKKDTIFFNKDENKVLLKEMPIAEEDLEGSILRYLDCTFGNESERRIIYFADGELHSTLDEKLSNIVDGICYEKYAQAIIVNNEMINKEYIITAQTKKSRKTIIEALLTNDDTEMFMHGTSQEATIYRALLVGTGIVTGEYSRNVENILHILETFIMNAASEKRHLVDLVDILVSDPIGMRRGILPVYLAYAISQHNEDIVIYFNRKEVAITAEIILNICENPEDYYIYISLEDIRKERYISDLCNMFDIQNNQKLTDSRISNIFNAMQRWFRSLPQVTKNIKKQDEYLADARLVRAYPKLKKVLQNVEANPYEVIFFELPSFFEVGDDYILLIDELGNLKSKLNGYFEWIANVAVERTKQLFGEECNDELHHILYEWYEKQSNIARQGVHSAGITGFMSCISNNTSYDEVELIKKLVRATTEVYLDSWNDMSMNAYIKSISELKKEIEAMSDEVVIQGNSKITYIDKSGREISKYYEKVDENTGSIFRNILEDSIEDFSDLSANDKVAILVEMIEKVLE